MGLGIHCLTLDFRHAVELPPSVQAVNAHAQTGRELACSVAALGHLLDGCDIEFLCVLLSAHTLSLCKTCQLPSRNGDVNSISGEKRGLPNLSMDILEFTLTELAKRNIIVQKTKPISKF